MAVPFFLPFTTNTFWFGPRPELVRYWRLSHFCWARCAGVGNAGGSKTGSSRHSRSTSLFSYHVTARWPQISTLTAITGGLLNESAHRNGHLPNSRQSSIWVICPHASRITQEGGRRHRDADPERSPS